MHQQQQQQYNHQYRSSLLIFFTIFLFLACSVFCSIPLAKPRATKPGDSSNKWKHCYGPLLMDEGGVVIQSASITFVDRADKVPAIKFTAKLESEQVEKLDRERLLYKLELWHESTGAKIRYRGNFTDLEVVRAEEENSSMVKLEVSKPLHVEYDGNYEATLVLFYYRAVPGKVPPTQEMDERLCADVKFSFQSGREAPTTKAQTEEIQDTKEVVLTDQVQEVQTKTEAATPVAIANH